MYVCAHMQAGRRDSPSHHRWWRVPNRFERVRPAAVRRGCPCIHNTGARRQLSTLPSEDNGAARRSLAWRNTRAHAWADAFTFTCRARGVRDSLLPPPPPHKQQQSSSINNSNSNYCSSNSMAVQNSRKPASRLDSTRGAAAFRSRACQTIICTELMGTRIAISICACWR